MEIDMNRIRFLLNRATRDVAEVHTLLHEPAPEPDPTITQFLATRPPQTGTTVRTLYREYIRFLRPVETHLGERAFSRTLTRLGHVKTRTEAGSTWVGL